MNAYIYCRVFPNNSKVSRPDRLKAQRQRCVVFAQQNRIGILRTFYDEGDMPPQHFLPNLTLLLCQLSRQQERTLVISDHIGRLGTSDEIRVDVIRAIEKADGRFLSVFPSIHNHRANVSIKGGAN